MIESITVTNYLNETIKMELARPEKSGFAITHIEGLGPSKATINSNELATTDGSVYNSARVNTRNIVIQMRFLFQPTIEEVRQKSYKYFPVKKQLKLLIETDKRTSEIYGYVESNEPDIFSTQEGTQISIICPDPYFYSTYLNNTVFSGVEPMFEFPFSNESLTENLLIFGNIVKNQTDTVYYDGDADTGIFIILQAIDEATNISIFNTNTRDQMHIDTDRLVLLTGSGVVSGDEILISTVRGNKYIRLLRDGIYTNILNCLKKGSDWIQISKGDNVLAYTAETGVDNLYFRVENRIMYEGV